MEKNEQQYLRKSIFWQRLMIILGGGAILLLVAYGIAYAIFTAPLRDEEWVILGILGAITAGFGLVFFFLLLSSRASSRYLATEDEIFLRQTIHHQKRFWQVLCLLLCTIVGSFVGLFAFLFFAFARL